jgi:3D (Asp-Asp-Asp) domain-containing protein
MSTRGRRASLTARRRALQWFVTSVVLFCGREPLSAAQTSSPEAFIVTAYCQHGITKSGVRAVPGVAAADPKYLPLGSVVGVATQPSTDLAIYTVADTGAKVKGHHLDVFTPDCSRAKQFGRRLLQLTILRLGWHTRLLPPRPASSLVGP